MAGAGSSADAQSPWPTPGGLRIATVMVDQDGYVSYFDSKAESLTGFASAQVLGTEVTLLFDADEPLDVLELLRQPPGTLAEDWRLRTAEGDARTVQLYRHPVCSPDMPAYTLLQIVDVAEHEQLNAGYGLLDAFFRQSSVGFAILDGQLRYVALNDALARLNRRPLLDHIGRRLREVLGSADIELYESLLLTVLRTGEPVHDLHIAGYPTSAPGSRRITSASWQRLIGADGSPIGLCGVVTEVTESHLDELDAARNRERLDLLSRVGALQGATLELQRICQDLAELLVEEHGDFVVVDLVHDVLTGGPTDRAPAPDTLISRVGAAFREHSAHVDRIFNIDNPRPASQTNLFAQVMADGRARVVHRPDLDAAPALSAQPERRAAFEKLGLDSIVVAPLTARGTILGCMAGFRSRDRSPFDASDRELYVEIANRTALSIDNARLYRDAQNAAAALQRSLLPNWLPQVPGADIAVRTRTGRADRHAGGDWYDAVQLPGRRLALVLGDVAGHGVQAAAAMGHCRVAARTLAAVGLSPATLLTRLNALVGEFTGEVTASCVCVVYDPSRDSCTIASAGHPPPILAPPDRLAEPVEVAGGPLLGALPNAAYTSTFLPTPPGLRLLLYSDGLVESRTVQLDEGVSALARAMRDDAPLEELTDRLLTAAPDDEDDRTVLLARLRGLSTRR